MALAIAQKPESLSPFQHAEDQTQEKNFCDTEEISVIGIPSMATNDLNQAFLLITKDMITNMFLEEIYIWASDKQCYISISVREQYCT